MNMDEATSANLDWKLIWQAAEDERFARGWTKRDLFKHAGISHTAYFEMQSGTPLRRADKITSFIGAFGWTTDDLVTIGQGGPAPEMRPTPTADSPIEERLEHMAGEIAVLQELVMAMNRSVRRHEQLFRELANSDNGINGK